MTSLGDEFPNQEARLREMLGHYKKIGPAGAFGAAMIEDCLRRADRAVIDQDTVAMIRICKEMQEFSE